MTPEEELREERISIMVFCGGLTEAEALAILNQAQGELFERGKG